MDYRAEYLKWKTDTFFDEKTREEIAALTDEKEIEDRFYRQLSFGTGGLRGILGAGTNRMNFYTVGKASQGLADYINAHVKKGSVAIAYDSRRMSAEFALDTALILAGNGIKAYLFDALRPTPELSFAVRYLKATAGVVITASHNPPEYNGYKVYWSDGAQVTPPHDEGIIACVNATEYKDVKRADEKTAEKNGLLEIIGEKVDNAFYNAVTAQVVHPEIIKEQAKNLTIVYTPLNGSGKVPVLSVLKRLGFEKVYTVKEQAEPDGNFPTLAYPNPEDPKAFTLALKLAREKNADIVLATDPDADRLGVYAKNKNGEYVAFTGNMSGQMIAEYQLSERKKAGTLTKDPKDTAVVTTIVSSDMSKKIAEEYGVTLFSVLTGFKYIGEKIRGFESATERNGGKPCAEKGAYKFLFGFEESYGCLVGTHARDKDAVVAVTALCELCAFCKSRGMTLCDYLENMFAKYGYFKESLVSKSFKGADGARKIQAITENLRKDPLDKIGGLKVLAVRDYLTGERKDLITGKITPTGLAKSNVLYYELESDCWCCARPSGTEPKIKFYFGVKGKTEKDAEKLVKETENALIAAVGE